MHAHLAWVCAWDAVAQSDAVNDCCLCHQGPLEPSLALVLAVTRRRALKQAKAALVLSLADPIAADRTHRLSKTVALHPSENVTTGEGSPGLAKPVARPVSGCERVGSGTDCASQRLRLDAGMSAAYARALEVGPDAQHGLLSWPLQQGLRHLCHVEQTE